MSNIKEGRNKPRVHVSQPISWSMVAILCDSVAIAVVVVVVAVVVVVIAVVVVVVRTRPRAMPVATITMTKLIHRFPLLSHMGMRLRRNSVIGIPKLKLNK